MPRKSVVGTRSSLLWLLVLIGSILLVGVAVVGWVILPQLQARRTEQVRLAEAERQYQAGLTSQAAERWDDSITAFTEVIRRAPGFKDASDRLGQVSQARAAAGASADATATAQIQVERNVRATATAQALETHYQKGLGYVNLKQWTQVKGELEQVFEVAPNYKDVQAQLALAAEALSREAPTSTPIQATTPTPAVVMAANIAPQGRVEVSSVYPYQPADCYGGAKAVDGVVENVPCRDWATSGEGAGAWLRITFSSSRHVNQVILYDRPNPTDYVIQGKLTFSDGSELETGDLPNSGAPRKLSFEQKSVTWIKFTVVQSTGPNIGLGEIEIYGW